MTKVDVGVIGGGPAGSSLAAALANAGAKVALVESTDFREFRVGEVLNRTAQHALARIGFDVSAHGCGIPGPLPTSEWGDDGYRARQRFFAPKGFSWIVERREFDRALFLHAGQMGARLFRQTRVAQARRLRGVWHFDVIGRKRALSLTAACIVEATGRTGRSCFTAAVKRSWVDRLVGITVVSRPTSRSSPSPLVKAFEDGWIYSASVPSGRQINILFTDADILAAKRAALLGILRSATQGSGSNRPTVFDARTSFRHVAVSDGWFAIGDALVAIDPLAGSGVANALAMAEAAAPWALRHVDDSQVPPAWVEQVAGLLNNYLRQRLAVYSVEQRWPDSLFWARRHGSTGATAVLAAASGLPRLSGVAHEGRRPGRNENYEHQTASTRQGDFNGATRGDAV